MISAKSSSGASEKGARKPRALSTSPRRALRTTEAARYLGVSVSLLRKLRSRGPDDPGRQGPLFIKLSPTLVVYEIEELDRWLESRRSTPAAA